MTPDQLDQAEFDEAERREEAVPGNDIHDDDNRLRPEFVRKVRDALREKDDDTVYDLVEPLHPADVADLAGMVAWPICSS